MGRSKHIHCCTCTWRKSPFVPMLGESTAQDATAPQAVIATELLFKIKINKLDQTSNRSGQKSPLATLRKINHFNCAMRHNLGDPINLWLSVGARRGKPGEVSSAPARLLLSQEPRELLRELHIAQSYTCTERQPPPPKKKNSHTTSDLPDENLLLASHAHSSPATLIWATSLKIQVLREAKTRQLLKTTPLTQCPTLVKSVLVITIPVWFKSCYLIGVKGYLLTAELSWLAVFLSFTLTAWAQEAVQRLPVCNESLSLRPECFQLLNTNRPARLRVRTGRRGCITVTCGQNVTSF